MVIEGIGYTVVGRRTAALIFGGFLVGVLGLGLALRRSKRPGLIGWLSPVLAVATAATFVALGEASRRSVPPTIGIAAIVEGVPGSDEAAAMASRRLSPTSDRFRLTDKAAEIELTRKDWRADPRRPDRFRRALGGFRFSCRDTNGAVPFHASTRETGRRPVRAGWSSGSTRHGDSSAGRCRSSPAGRQPCGSRTASFAGRADDALPPGQYLTAAVMTDQQQRRHATYRELLAESLPKHWEGRNLLLAWADAGELPFRVNEGDRLVGSALLVIPLEFERPEVGTRITIPRAFIPISRLIQGRPQQPVLEGTYASEMAMLFQLPPSVLPLTIERARLSAKVRCPGRKFSIVAQSNAGPVTLFEAENPLDPIQIEITDSRVLRLDPDGRLRLTLQIGEQPRDADGELPRKRSLNRAVKDRVGRREGQGQSSAGESRSRTIARYRYPGRSSRLGSKSLELPARAGSDSRLSRGGEWMGTTGPVLETRELTKRYGKFVALDRLSISVDRGQILGFIGPNGAGKTTTIKILVGLARPTSGTATVAGADCVADARRVKRLIGYMPDTFGSYDNLRVGEYLDFFGAAFGIRRRERMKRIDEVLQTSGAGTFKDLYVEALSHGMKQRVALARTLLHDPPVLILDEPANGLDPQARIEMRQLLLDLADRGKTLIVTSHILPELARICHRIAIITRGRLRAYGTLPEISRQLNQQRTMEVLLPGPEAIERVAEIVRQHIEPGMEITASVAESVVRFRTAKDEEELVGLLQSLASSGLNVTQFREVQSDLEEAFMTVARAEHQDDAEGIQTGASKARPVISGFDPIILVQPRMIPLSIANCSRSCAPERRSRPNSRSQLPAHYSFCCAGRRKAPPTSAAPVRFRF